MLRPVSSAPASEWRLPGCGHWDVGCSSVDAPSLPGGCAHVQGWWGPRRRGCRRNKLVQGAPGMWREEAACPRASCLLLAWLLAGREELEPPRGVDGRFDLGGPALPVTPTWRSRLAGGRRGLGVTPVSEYLRLKAPWEWRCPICLRPALADAMAGWARRFVGFFASLGASILCHTWPDTPLSPGDRPPRLQSWIRLRAGVGAVPLRRSRGGGRCWGWAAASLWEEQTEAGCGYGDQPGPGLSPAADQQGWPLPLGSLMSRLLLPTLSTRPTSGAGL